MPIFIASLLGGLASAMTSLVGRVLLALGISYVSYSGLDAIFNNMAGDVFAGLNGAPALALQVFGILQVGTAINIIVSATVSAVSIKFITGSFKKMVIK